MHLHFDFYFHEKKVFNIYPLMASIHVWQLKLLLQISIMNGSDALERLSVSFIDFLLLF
jgi:hypothetical protein